MADDAPEKTVAHHIEGHGRLEPLRGFGEPERVYDTYADAVDHAGGPALLTLNLEVHRLVPIERDRRCLH